MRDGNSPTTDEPAQTTGGSAGITPGITAGEPGAVHVILGSDRTRIVLSGEVDADLGPDLQEATTDAEQAGLPIEVDAHHVTFMDSSGVAFLARLSIRSQHRVRLLRVPPTVRFLLEVTRIGELLDVVDGDDEPHGFDAAPEGPTDEPGPSAT
ncbi:STAS domain-containing protein [Cellulomonas chengniuliangii]|uniref:STAS domain-containing protein n=1 Tax=Cellulomonas chengniuliangii TaxID=2968084 RepID=A0ABY5L0C7_9CELL|nr:STAS domain-containing protein [Cellulomonas chengniuliangii]MCC2307702.1 STAS domain-containing protein [Cellulomonas chengniuliangii]MCC2318814.1 STAS domain-containing protein [Cellulomonas chengniuliangii]UUI75538.1 STAS domain-containing protein [Cellulomonas chengniuliangii]